MTAPLKTLFSKGSVPRPNYEKIIYPLCKTEELKLLKLILWNVKMAFFFLISNYDINSLELKLISGFQ
jgi:hypothetical protein